MIKHDPNKITATMKLVVTGEFYDDEASEETLRYCIEQDLEDAGFEVDVSLLKEQEAKQVINIDDSFEGMEVGNCPSCNRAIVNLKIGETKFCKFCGQAVKWENN